MVDSNFQIPDEPPRKQYVATSGQTVFNVPFPFFQDSDVKVLFNSNTTPEDPADYTITGEGTNVDGVLTFAVGLTAGTLVTIYRDSEISRTTNFVNSGEWTAQNVNNQFNRLVTFIQEVALKAVDLSARLPITSLLTSLVFPDEGAAANQNKCLVWDPTGTFLVNGPSIAALTNAEATVAAATAQAAIATTQAGISTTKASEAATSAAQAAASAAGMKLKVPARASTTAALPTCVYANGAAGVGATLTASANGALAAQDGVTLINSEYLLVKNQATTFQNGLYVVTQIGTAGTPWILTRATDSDTWAEVFASLVIVAEGTVNADTQWLCSSNNGGTMGVTAITWLTLNSVIADGAVSTTAKLANLIVTGAKIADLTITYGKMVAAEFATVAELIAGTPNKFVNAANLKTYNDNIKNSRVRLDTANGAGSTNISIRRFTNAVLGSYTTDITYADSAANGASFTINTTGVYAISYVDQFNVGNLSFGISKNSTQLSTNILTITAADRLGSVEQPNNGTPQCYSVTTLLTAGDVIRPHLSTASSNGTAALSSFLIQRVV